MMPNLAVVEKHVFLSPAEREMLISREKPIVILTRRPNSSLPSDIAPGQDTIGVMLPYTPLHHLLLEPAAGFPESLVMTSGNLSEEPIATGVQEARLRLSDLADCFLFHDRDIQTRCDDSVVRAFPLPDLNKEDQYNRGQQELYPLRRARGYAPFPIQLPWGCPTILAGGAELKNSFCFTRDRYGILSHHIGDLENFETLNAFESCIVHYEKLFRLKPEALAYDLHPNYLATRYILERSKAEDIPAFGVQHHHAHIASAMAEHGMSGREKVIGFSFDGTGYGTDGAIWGGEVLLADYDSFERSFHLDYTPLPGGDKAIQEPWRFALAWLYKADIPWSEAIPPVNHGMSIANSLLNPIDLLRRQLESGINCPPTSSMGRLFDAVASLIGLRHQVNFEAQAAVELEALVDKMESSAYSIDLVGNKIDPRQMLGDILADVSNRVPLPIIAARFHNGLAQMVLDISLEIRSHYALNQVVLSGGVWQNVTLLARTIPLLRREGFAITIHRRVPANDGGLSLGQAVIAASHFEITNLERSTEEGI
jgi:hydrogenase maturation protein HypF